MTVNSAGLIPAHAGKTLSEARFPPGRRAHPRSRGENLTPAGVFVIQGGSSPLTRGKRSSERSPGLSTGLIPAHAGKTEEFREVRGRNRAHPRSRGENSSSRS